jgi:hypothetical protein
MVKVKEDMTGWIMSKHGFPNSRIIVIKQADDYISPQGQHYARWLCRCTCGNQEYFVVNGLELRNGDTQSCGCLRFETRKKYNKVVLNLEDENGLYGIGYCSNTNQEFYFDMEDYDKIKEYCWYEISVGAYTTMEAWDKNTNTQIKMHWLIAGKYCDHADRNALNNRKYNLRKASNCENARNRGINVKNRSGFTGVVFTENGAWLSQIGVNNKKLHLGTFKEKEDAIRARLEAEAKYFGEFAPQRHLFEQYNINVKDGDANDIP